MERQNFPGAWRRPRIGDRPRLSRDGHDRRRHDARTRGNRRGVGPGHRGRRPRAGADASCGPSGAAWILSAEETDDAVQEALTRPPAGACARETDQRAQGVEQFRMIYQFAIDEHRVLTRIAALRQLPPPRRPPDTGPSTSAAEPGRGLPLAGAPAGGPVPATDPTSVRRDRGDPRHRRGHRAIRREHGSPAIGTPWRRRTGRPSTLATSTTAPGGPARGARLPVRPVIMDMAPAGQRGSTPRRGLPRLVRWARGSQRPRGRRRNRHRRRQAERWAWAGRAAGVRPSVARSSRGRRRGAPQGLLQRRRPQQSWMVCSLATDDDLRRRRLSTRSHQSTTRRRT